MAANICKHRKIFPARGIEIAAVIIFALMTALANFGGIGGGFVHIVLFAMFGFDLKTAIVLSNAQIAISSIIRIFFGIGKSHPVREHHGSLYNFQVVSLMVPANALGASLAALINRVIPDVAIIILNACLLTVVFAFNFGKLRMMVKKELLSGKPAAAQPAIEAPTVAAPEEKPSD